MMPPLVSILTPSFNQATWLRDNLNSVRAQTYPNIEHVVVDGGSTDGSTELLRAEAGSRVRWVSEPDEGQSDAVNKAFAWSRGDIIGWINSDDAYADTRAVERAVRIFEQLPSVDVVYGDILEVTRSNEAIGVAQALPARRTLRRLGINPVRQPGAFIRRSAISSRFLDPDLHYVMDHELFFRLLDSGHRFVHVHHVAAVNRRTPGRKTMSVNDVAAFERTRVFGSGTGVRGSILRWLRYALSVTNRAASLPMFLRLEQHVTPALALSLPSRPRRLVLQLATRLDAYAMREGDR